MFDQIKKPIPTGESALVLVVGAGPAGLTSSLQQLVERIRAAAGDPQLAVQIIATGAWEACATVAESFRDGPVLLSGDAAHQHTPGGGFGMTPVMKRPLVASPFASGDCRPATPCSCTACSAPGPCSSVPMGTSLRGGPPRLTSSSRRCIPSSQPSSAGTT